MITQTINTQQSASATAGDNTIPPATTQSAWQHPPAAVRTPPDSSQLSSMRSRRSASQLEDENDPFNFREVRRCHWCTGSRPFPTVTGFLTHLTKLHAGLALRVESVHLDQVRLLGIQLCVNCTKPRSTTAAQCNSTECGSRRTKTPMAKREAVIRWSTTDPDLGPALRSQRPWQPIPGPANDPIEHDHDDVATRQRSRSPLAIENGPLPPIGSNPADAHSARHVHND